MRTARSRPRSVLARLLRLVLVCLGGLVVVCAVRWQATLNWFGNYLVRSDPIEHSDLILVMGGDFYGPRVFKAAELVQSGAAPSVLISGPYYRGRPEGELAIEYLASKGYSTNKLAVFAHDQPSTVGEVRAVGDELVRRGVQRVIVVTSSYHSRRCLILFHLFYPAIRFISAPSADPIYRPNEWWNDPGSRDLVRSEWTKIVGSIFVAYPAYRVSAWTSRWNKGAFNWRRDCGSAVAAAVF